MPDLTATYDPALHVHERPAGPKLRSLVDTECNWRAPAAQREPVARMAREIPALRPIADDNTYGDHQDVLTHMLLAEVVYREVENAEAGRLEKPRAVAVADLLESMFEVGHLVPGEGDADDADEAVGVSFVENMPYPGEPGQALLGFLGPRLRAELERERGPIGS